MPIKHGVPPLYQRRPNTTRAIGGWWMGRGRTVAAPPAGLDYSIYEGGILVGSTTAADVVVVYEGGILVGDTKTVDAVSVYEGGILVGGTP